MSRSARPTLGDAAFLAVLLFVAGAGCGSEAGEAASGGKAKPRIAFLLPESKTARYETQDRPHFEAKVKELCPDCQVSYSNASQDIANQHAQADAALANGADVLVLDPVDSAAAAAVARNAKAAAVPVVSYDRLVLDVDVNYYVSFDNERVGELQARTLVDRLRAQGRPTGTIVMINGSPTDHNASLFKLGAHRAFDRSAVQVGAEYDTPDWSPDQAQREMEQAITKLGVATIAGVYAANDGTAGGAIAAMKGAGFRELPPITGQDAELAAVQRILAGEQYMTVYKAIRREAEAAAILAVALARGEEPPPGLVNGEVDNGKRRVPSVLLDPVPVTRENIRATVVADGFWSAAQICTADLAAACRSAGIDDR